jgi:hypothetical protein
MAEFVGSLIWLGIGTSGGLVFAVVFYLIARYLNTREAKTACDIMGAGKERSR